MKIVINMDEALELYYDVKRDKNICYMFDKEKQKFTECDKNSNNGNRILFIDCFKTANEVIDIYLSEDGMEEHKKAFESFIKTGNRVTDILWYFEYIDGAYSFEDFECLYVAEKIKKWCSENDFDCTEVENMK